MSNPELSNEFDLQYNNIMSNQAPGLDPYEKSVYFTLAQEQLGLTYYNGKNTYGESFEKTEEIRRYLSKMVKTATLTPDEYSDCITENSTVFTLPENLWFITYEYVTLEQNQGTCASGKRVQVVPVTQDDLYRTLENPFKNIGLRRALRLDIENNQVEIVSKYKIASYTIRYLEQFPPIILEDLDPGTTIDGLSCAVECTLPKELHRTLIELAVKLASAAYKAGQQQ